MWIFREVLYEASSNMESSSMVRTADSDTQKHSKFNYNYYEYTQCQQFGYINSIFCDMTPYNPTERHKKFGLPFNPEDGRSTFPRKVDETFDLLLLEKM
jgi:hypothetical protein